MADGDGDDFDDVTNDADSDGVADSQDNCPNLANTNQADGDSDQVGDACDCEPADGAIAATVVLSDNLDINRNTISEATGFSAGNWAFSGGRLVQNRLADDGSDAILFNLPEALGDLRVELTAASIEIADFGADDLRQLFVVARTSAAADDFAAEACGIEVVEGTRPDPEDLRGHPRRSARCGRDHGPPADRSGGGGRERRPVYRPRHSKRHAHLHGHARRQRRLDRDLDHRPGGRRRRPLHPRDARELRPQLKICRY